MFLSSLRTVQRVTASLPIPAWARPRPRRPRARRLRGADHLVVGARLGAARAGAGHPRRRLRRGAARDHRRRLAAERAGRASSCSLPLSGAKLVASSLTIGSGGSAGDFAPVAGARRPLRRRLRPRRRSSCSHDPQHRSGRLRAGRNGHVLRRHRPRAVSARWSWCASWRAATTCSCRSCSPRASRSSRCASASLYQAQVPTTTIPPFTGLTDFSRAARPTARRGRAHRPHPFQRLRRDDGSRTDAAGTHRRDLADHVSDRRSRPSSEHRSWAWSARHRSRLLSPDNPAHAEASPPIVMQPAARHPQRSTMTCGEAAELILESGFRQLPVVGPEHKIAGFLEESEVTRAYLGVAPRKDD